MKKTKLFRGIAAIACLGLLGMLAALYAITWFEISPPDYVTPLLSTAIDSEPAILIEPLPDDIVALRPAVAAKAGWEGLLVRELARQAVLIAARDELGLRTRDATLREILPDSDFKALQGIDAHVVSPPDGTMFVGIGRSGGDFNEIEFYKIPRGSNESRIAYIARSAEAASREAFVERLTSIGFKSRKSTATLRAPLATEGRFATYEEPSQKVVERFDIISQFAAVRAWHDTIRAHGETPEALSGLVRGYANLGMLTSRHWSSSQKAYQARSLLYAERLLRLTGDTPSSLRWRAYARAFVGLPALSAEDLDAADAVMPADEEIPAWCDVLEAYTAGDIDELKRHRETRDPMARVVACVLVLDDAELSGLPNRIEEAAQALRDVSPTNNRGLTALLNSKMPLGVLRENVDSIRESGREWLYTPLVQSGLPIPVKLAAVPDDPKAEGEFRKALLDGLIGDERLRTDAGEPSLVAMGRLLEEEGILHAQSVLITYGRILDLDAERDFHETLNWYSHHPYAAALRLLAPVALRVGALPELEKTLKTEQLLPSAERIQELFARNFPDIDRSIELLRENCDETEKDLAWRIEHPASKSEMRALASALERVSPNSAITARSLVAVDPAHVADRIPDWERRFPGDAGLMKNLAQWHSNETRYDDAVRCLKSATRIAPEFETFERLASIYELLGDDAGYVRTYSEWLDQPDKGLSHSLAAARIAYWHCRWNRWQDALPFALIAADSYSANGLMCASFVLEGLGDYPRAEAYQRAVSERYENSSAWYHWCVRTGLGDLRAAEAQERRAIADWQNSADFRNHSITYGLAFSALLHGRDSEALAGYRRMLHIKNDASDAVLVALLADELGDAATRSEALAKAAEMCDGEEMVLGELVRVLREDLNGRSFDAGRLAEWILDNSLGSREAGSQLFFLAWYLTNRGRDDEALPFLKIAAASPFTDDRSAILAGQLLTGNGHGTVRCRGTVLNQEVGRVSTLVSAGARLSRAMPQWALPRLDEALAIRPKFVVGLSWRANTLAALGRHREALVDCDVLVNELPFSPRSYLLRGDVRAFAGDDAMAATDYEEALRLSRLHGTSASLSAGLLSLAMLRATSRDPSVVDAERAIQHADEATTLALAPEWDRKRVRAAALAAAGRFDEAIFLAETAITENQGRSSPWHEHQLAHYRRHERFKRPEGWWRVSPVAAGPVEARRP